jgi:hypothetical protein
MIQTVSIVQITGHWNHQIMFHVNLKRAVQFGVTFRYVEINRNRTQLLPNII